MISKNAEKTIRQTMFKFLDPKEYRVFIFGSRATGRAGKFSDYDIGIIGKKQVPLGKLSLIEEVFEESDLPIRVDVVDFFAVSKNFKKVALSRVKQLL